MASTPHGGMLAGLTRVRDARSARALSWDPTGHFSILPVEQRLPLRPSVRGGGTAPASSAELNDEIYIDPVWGHSPSAAPLMIVHEAKLCPEMLYEHP